MMHGNIKSFQTRVAFHIENMILISNSNEITGFCMKFNIGLKFAKHILLRDTFCMKRVLVYTRSYYPLINSETINFCGVKLLTEVIKFSMELW